jgi:DnaJ-domain-containing protein 1
MGQIFNRLKRISSSYINENDEEILHGFDSDKSESDAKLKKMIEDLGKKNSESEKKYNNKNNPYQVLEIDNNSNISEIKQAYLKKIKEYHPDRTANLGKEIQDLASAKSKQINSAFEQIKKERGVK